MAMSTKEKEIKIKGQRVWQDTASGPKKTSDQQYGDFGLQISLKDQAQDFLAQISLYIPDFYSDHRRDEQQDTYLGIFLDDEGPLFRGVVRTGGLDRRTPVLVQQVIKIKCAANGRGPVVEAKWMTDGQKAHFGGPAVLTVVKIESV